MLSGSGPGSVMRYSHDVTETAASESFDGAGGSPPKVAHSHGCWQEASVLHHVGLSTGLLECLGSVVAGFPQVSDPSQSKVDAQCLCDPTSEVRCCHFCHILLVTQIHTVQCEKGPHGTMETSKDGSLGAVLEAGYHRDAVSSILGLPRQKGRGEIPPTPNTTLYKCRYIVQLGKKEGASSEPGKRGTFLQLASVEGLKPTMVP